jgi:hypothetical protein
MDLKLGNFAEISVILVIICKVSTHNSWFISDFLDDISCRRSENAQLITLVGIQVQL